MPRKAQVEFPRERFNHWLGGHEIDEIHRLTPYMTFAQKVANELYNRTGVSPDVVAPDGYTGNTGTKGDDTGVVKTTVFGAAPNPNNPKESGKLVHFTAGPKDKELEK